MQTASRRDLTPASSYVLQKLLRYDFIYTFIFFTLEFFIFIAKGYGLYYPKGTLAGEIVILSFFFIYELIRKESGTSGNKTENSSLTCTFIVLNIVSLGGFIFFLALQRYVLLIEIIMNVLGIIFAVCEAIFALGVIRNFKNE